MKKRTIVFTFFVAAIAVCSTTLVSAHTGVGAHASTSTEVNTGGGLGKGINYMVRGILDDAAASQAPAVPPQPALMMNANAAADVRLAPEAQTMSTKTVSTLSATMAAAPMTKDDLHAYILELIHADSRIQAVDTAESHVRITHAVPTKMLGKISVVMKVTAGVYASGATEVSYPWYAFMTPTGAANFKQRFAAQFESRTQHDPLTFEDQKMLIDEIHIALSGAFGSSTGGDQ